MTDYVTWSIGIKANGTIYYVSCINDNTTEWTKVYSNAVKFVNGIRAQQYKTAHFPDREDVFLVDTVQIGHDPGL